MLTKEAIIRYEPVQMAEAKQLMFDVLVDPEVNSILWHSSVFTNTVVSAFLRSYIPLFLLRRVSHPGWWAFPMQRQSVPRRIFRSPEKMESHLGTRSTAASGLVSGAQVHPGKVGPVEDIV